MILTVVYHIEMKRKTVIQLKKRLHIRIQYFISVTKVNKFQLQIKTGTRVSATEISHPNLNSIIKKLPQ